MSSRHNSASFVHIPSSETRNPEKSISCDLRKCNMTCHSWWKMVLSGHVIPMSFLELWIWSSHELLKFLYRSLWWSYGEMMVLALWPCRSMSHSQGLVRKVWRSLTWPHPPTGHTHLGLQDGPPGRTAQMTSQQIYTSPISKHTHCVDIKHTNIFTKHNLFLIDPCHFLEQLFIHQFLLVKFPVYIIWPESTVSWIY